MAIDGMPAADSDMHVMEPADLWQRYMDPKWEHAAPVGMTEIERDMRVKVKNHVLLRLGHVRPACRRPPVEAGTGLRVRRTPRSATGTRSHR